MDNVVKEIGLSGAKVDRDDSEEKKEVNIKPISFLGARMKDESWEDYKVRRKQINKWKRMVRLTKSVGEDNRKQRRVKTKGTKLRLTKPLKRVRKKWLVGRTDVTEALKRGIPLQSYLRVASMGLDIEKLQQLGNEITEECKDGNNTDTVAK